MPVYVFFSVCLSVYVICMYVCLRRVRKRPPACLYNQRSVILDFAKAFDSFDRSVPSSCGVKGIANN